MTVDQRGFGKGFRHFCVFANERLGADGADSFCGRARIIICSPLSRAPVVRTVFYARSVDLTAARAALILLLLSALACVVLLVKRSMCLHARMDVYYVILSRLTRRTCTL